MTKTPRTRIMRDAIIMANAMLLGTDMGLQDAIEELDAVVKEELEAAEQRGRDEILGMYTIATDAAVQNALARAEQAEARIEALRCDDCGLAHRPDDNSLCGFTQRLAQAEAQRDRLRAGLEEIRTHLRNYWGPAEVAWTVHKVNQILDATEAQTGGVTAEHSDLEWIALCAGDILAAIQLASDGEYTLREFLVDAGRSCSRMGDHISAMKAVEQARKDAQAGGGPTPEEFSLAEQAANERIHGGQE